MTKPKLILLLAVFLSAVYCSYAQPTFPVNDVDNPKEGCYAFINATVVKDSRTTLQNATLIIRKGKIEAVGATVAIPKEAIVVDCKGKYIYPSFIDPYTDYGIDASKAATSGGGFRNFQLISNTKGPYGWNQAIRSEVNAAGLFAVNEARAKELRAAGIGTVLTHQADGISRGTGAVVTLANERENLVMLKEKATAHYSFNKGSSTQSYPGSLMGAIALLRQNFLDAQWYKTKPDAEGANLSLQAFNENLSLPQVFETGDKWNVLRADKVGDEFGVQYIIKTGGDEYQRISEIKATNATLIVPVNFPQAMDVDDPADARYIALADLKHWELAPGNAAALEKANINFAFTAFGLKEASAFIANLRKAVNAGLSEQKAIDALTKIPATIIGIADKAGSLDAGKLANFIITSGPLFDEKTVLHQNWVQGNRYVVKDDNWKEIKGKYKLAIKNAEYTLELKDNTGKAASIILAGDTAKAEVSFAANLVKINFAFKKDSTRLTRLSGVVSEANWQGTGETQAGEWVNWYAERTGDTAATDSSRKKKTADDKNLSEIVYPFNGYGTAQPARQENLLIKNATVWTSEKQGILTNTDVLVKNGKIAAIGKSLSDASARVIDGTGKHLSAGIIDEHSHIAITGGVNECSQSVTSETRVADVLNPDDVSLYRHLSGGVTSTHLLHGSCNTIGGQTQLIKIRWGANAEQLKFAGWDPFIKFALGENVKRSSTVGNSRFPDTRMGVEEVLNDAFIKAAAYMREGQGKRRDLKLDALVEIMNKKRFITCHSYVQSEINMMIKIAERYGFTLNTFTHILEGYKVADKMKAHGAAASTFSDWWTYKMEVIDAIPQNAYIMQQLGLTVAINSDDAEMATRLNQEAAKSITYAGMDEQEALKMVTINPAIMLHVADRTGSIKVGKDADLVLWSDAPLSIYAKAEKTIVDGIIYFDREKDKQLRETIAKERQRLIQKMIAVKKNGEKTVPAVPSFREMNYCGEEGHTENSIWDRIEHRIGASAAE